MTISDAMYTALSGLQAASTQMNAAASNIANLDSTGYQARQVNFTDLPNGGGVALASVTADTTPAAIDPNGNAGSNVDLADESVQMIRANELYNANAVALRVSSQMTGTLLDMFDSGDHRGK